jgi:hypothetical protein
MPAFADLNRDLKSGEEKLDFIEKTVRQVESKREQFSHIDESELSARRNFVQDTRQVFCGTLFFVGIKKHDHFFSRH